MSESQFYEFLTNLPLLLFFPAVLAVLLIAVAYELVVSSPYLKTLPKSAYFLGILSFITSLFVFNVYGEELAESAFMTFFAGATTSVFSSVIFYYLINHKNELDQKRSAYLAHHSDFIELSQQSMFESLYLGSFSNSSDFLHRYTNLTTRNCVSDNVAEEYLSYIETFYLIPDLQQFNRHKSILNRLNRSSVYFDQSVRNELVRLERQLDDILEIWSRFASYKHKEWLSDVDHKNAILEINNEQSFRQHVTGEFEYDPDLKRYIMHNAVQTLHFFSEAQAYAAHLSLSKFNLKIAFNSATSNLFCK